MKKVSILVIALILSLGAFSQTKLVKKPCTITWMYTRVWFNKYRDSDSLKNKLNAKVANPKLAYKDDNILVTQGFYTDSAGKRTYYSNSGEPWHDFYGKILKVDTSTVKTKK